MAQVRVVIVEDEAISRRELKRMVDAIEWLVCVSEAAHVTAAIDAINHHQPDVIFLDIKIPGGTGFDVLNQADFVPNIIFTTAFSDFAVDAFDHNAVDFLLKPFSKKRFDIAIGKLRSKLFDRLGQRHVDSTKVFVSSGSSMLPLTLTEVEHFSVNGDYVVTRSQDGERLLNTSLSALELELDPRQFVRIHRAHIVNIRYVHRMKKQGDRQLLVQMRSGASLLSSRAGTKKLQRFFWKLD